MTAGSFRVMGEVVGDGGGMVHPGVALDSAVGREREAQAALERYITAQISSMLAYEAMRRKAMTLMAPFIRWLLVWPCGAATR